MPLCTEDDPRVARCILLFLVLCQVIVYLVQLGTANPGSNKTKQKTECGKSLLKVHAKILNLKLQPEHHKKSVPQKCSVVQTSPLRQPLYHYIFTQI